LNKFFKNKKILITGHTGFKGSWLCSILLKFNANIVGISNLPPSKIYNFNELNLKKSIKHYIFDISKNKIKLQKIITREKPDFIFHLAAQPLVKKSLYDPVETFHSNFISSLYLLECFRHIKHKCNLIMITSDKVYKNQEWNRGYKEDDIIGGKDPYSASKGSIEILINSYYETFLKDKKNLYIATGRAGNVIGGGDWSDNRIIPDCIRNKYHKKKLIIRNPESTRPWQHVLEPLFGYILLAQKISTNNLLNGQSFNFGPKSKEVFSVINTIQELEKNIGSLDYMIKEENKSKESKLLKLNCSKAKRLLGWSPILSFKETLQMTSSWYALFYSNKKNLKKITNNQIEFYLEKFSIMH
jgi:CDP-glucose 4,6-dehydratase